MKNLTTATFLTFLRIFLIPAVFICYYLPFSLAHFYASLLFILAAITDWGDGFVARKFNQTTKLGVFLDPVADKLLVAVVLVMITCELNSLWLVLPSCIIVCREILVSALREWMAQVGNSQKVKVCYIGKVKTTFQLISLSALLFCDRAHEPAILYVLGFISLYIAAFLTIISMVIYLQAAKNDFN